MTAVPAQRTKTKDPFQLELHEELARRKSRGYKTGFSDNDTSEKEDSYSENYDEDFESGSEDNSDDDLLEEYLSSTTPMKSGTSGLEKIASDKNDETGGATKEENNLSQARKSPLLTKQHAIDEKQDTKNNLNDDPLLAFLNSDSHTTSPWKKPKSNESSLFKTESFGQQSTKKKVTFEPTASSLSPRESSFASTLPQPKSDPIDKQSSPNNSTSTITKSEDFPPLSGQRQANESMPKPASRRSPGEELLKPQPKTRRRHDSNRSSMSDESVARSVTKSPELGKLPEEKSTKVSTSLDYDVSKFPSLGKPSLQPIPKRSVEVTDENSTHPSKKEAETLESTVNAAETSKKLVQTDSDMTSSTEDLLAQLQTAADTKSPTKKSQEQPPGSESKLTADSQAIDGSAEKQETAVEGLTLPADLSEKGHIDETTYSFVQEDSSEKSGLDETHPKRPSSRRSTSRKSPRTPPVNYRGLGSLDGLQQLRTYKPNESAKLKTTTNVRSTVYLQWLADREKQLRAKKKLKLEEEEKENERLEKEKLDRVVEGASARKAWMEQKEVILKEQAQKKKRQEKRLEREKAKEEEEKRKSAKKADIVRERALDKAKERHREEMRKKKEEEREQRKQEKEKKKKNEEELNEWMAKRSTQWEKDRKKEIKEKKAKEKEVKKAKEEKNKQGEDSYTKWRENKEERDMQRRRVNRHDEDRPPWSPANKVIPRVR